MILLLFQLTAPNWLLVMIGVGVTVLNLVEVGSREIVVPGALVVDDGIVRVGDPLVQS
jgi:carbonic anhydrase/acetyltransferase-like protein (isoleucine patch superfamily)